MNINENINLFQLRVFIACAEYENFTRASEKLGTTVSTVSRTIATLESELGIILFVRHKQRVRLTPSGCKLSEELKPLLAEAEKAVEEAAEIQASQRTTLTIADQNTPTDSSIYLLPIVEALEASNPNIDVRIDMNPEEDLIDKIISFSYDAAFIADAIAPLFLKKGLKVKHFLDGRICLVISARHPLFDRQDVSWKDFRDDLLIAGNTGMYSVYWETEKHVMQELGFQLLNTRFVNTPDTMDAELHRKRCVALLDDIYANDSRTDLRRIYFDADIESRLPKQGISIAWSPDNDNPYLPELVKIAAKLERQ